jgi:hypothetical protein
MERPGFACVSSDHRRAREQGEDAGGASLEFLEVEAIAVV